ncbi:MAG TPA: hypothetical protein VFX60_05590 [Micromonospora sp.]|nr:hypothetical protein [Micromonospora sp.]
MRALTSPDNVVDVLLYRLATAVAANHQPHRHGSSMSLTVT